MAEGGWTESEQAVIDAQLRGDLPMFLTTREAVQAWRVLSAVVEGHSG